MTRILAFFAASAALVLLGCATPLEGRDAADSAAESAPPSVERAVTITGNSAVVSGTGFWVCNGIPKAVGWGEPLVFPLTTGTRTLGTSGGFPFVAVYSPAGGVAFFNTSTTFEPFKVSIASAGTNSYKITASGGSSIGSLEIPAGQDYFEALRSFANTMKTKGIAAQAAPASSFDPIWETYGFEENWSRDKIRALIPTFQKLGIKTITLDSGWYGKGTTDWDGKDGDYPINGQVGGSEKALKDFIAELHAKGFKVRAWWSPLNLSAKSQVALAHPAWLYSEEIPSYQAKSAGDWNGNPSLSDFQAFEKQVAARFVGYGFDGFKQDDVYQIALKSKEANGPLIYRSYAQTFQDIWATARGLKSDFTINTCNCGVAQNLYDFPGENELITSDPVGYQDIRMRGKVLQAFNVNGSAILGDHIELGKNSDVTPADLKNSSWFTDVDLASEVALGLVLQTKFTATDPGANYQLWFNLYNSAKLYQMEWVNVPFFGTYPERYIRKDASVMYQSYFMKDNATKFDGKVVVDHLSKGNLYTVKDVKTNAVLASFTAASDSYSLPAKFTGSLVLEVK